MSPFEQGSMPEDYFNVEHIAAKFAVDLEQAQRVVADNRAELIFLNDLYQVNVRKIKPLGDFPDVIWLSIKRRDKQPIRDWRHMQQIKNEIVGPEHEGVELYPAESRKVDTANQFHMWVLADPSVRFPFGFEERSVSGPEAVAHCGAVQRALDDFEIDPIL